MRVCFVANEIFAFGHYGGFGKLTRQIANGLIKRGVEVYVLTPKRSGDQRTIELLDNNIVVIGFPWRIKRLFSVVPLSKIKLLYKLPEADIYHSEAPSIDSWLAMKHNPKAKHIITFQDPRFFDFEGRWGILSLDLEKRRISEKYKYKLKFALFDRLVKRAVENADELYCQARYIIPKVVEMFDLDRLPTFLPNPVEIPKHKFHKKDEPTVLFLARWDLIKRPWIFFEIAKKMPTVHFICAGKSHDESLDKKLRNTARKIPNLECTGHVDPEGVLEKSWILVNCSVRECLPVSFLEACAYKCAIVSCNNPDNFASQFGSHIQNGENVDEYVSAINHLISDEGNLKMLGQSAYNYVKKTHELKLVIDKHLEIYRRLIGGY